MSTVTFENVCRAHTKRQVTIKMNKFNMFITAVCVLFFIKLRWPKNKSIYVKRWLTLQYDPQATLLPAKYSKQKCLEDQI